MCGICGFVSGGDISLEALRGMNDTMYHRGPNDSGAEIYVGEMGTGLDLRSAGFLSWIFRSWGISLCIRRLLLVWQGSV